MEYDFDTDPTDGAYTIVIGTDLSPASLPAITESLRLAGAVRSPVLHFVHAAPADSGNDVLAGLKERLSKDLADHAAAIKVPLPRNRNIHVRAGSPRDVVLSVAHDSHADLLVLGTRFDSPEDRVRFDSVSEEILHAAPCSVLVVNGRRRPKKKNL